MKKLLTVGLALAVLFLATGTASAHWRFGFFAPLPPLVVAPSPPAYYYPWILPAVLSLLLRLPSLGSGHWDWRWTSYGWQRIWFPDN